VCFIADSTAGQNFFSPPFHIMLQAEAPVLCLGFVTFLLGITVNSG
jgi:hypothetical protein